MPPRFVNPHFLPESSITVSRRDIYAEDYDPDVDDSLHADPQLVNCLKELIYTVLEPSPGHEGKRSKRRKIQSPLSTQEDEPIAFRLVSSVLPPHPILLRPKSPPPPITREPEVEDTEAQATLRAEHARETAVNGASILSRNHKPMPHFGDTKKLKPVKVASSLPSPPVIMVLESNQPPRSTRPPVSVSQLQHHPYNHGLGSASQSPSQSRPAASTFPVIKIAPTSPVTLTPTPSKRKRRRKTTRDRPAPVFWRPDPAVGGKSLGYGMGFPCSVEVLQSGSNAFTAYPRDTMRRFGPML